MSSSPPSIELAYEVGHPLPDRPNNTETSSPHNIRHRKQSVPLPRKWKFMFFALFLCFVISLVSFFSVIALTYPLKPEVYIEEFYVPAIDKITPNIERKDKDFAFFGLRFDNRNQLISASYDNFINVTLSIHYFPNSRASIYISDVTLPGFNQKKGKPYTIRVQTPGITGITGGKTYNTYKGGAARATGPLNFYGLLQLQKDYMTLRVDVGFSMRFHCRELGKHKHKHEFQMTAQVEVSLKNGKSYEKTIQMYETHPS